MTKMNKNNSGLLVCGACAVSANPDSNEPSSVELIGHAVKSLFGRRAGRKPMDYAMTKMH